MPRFHYRAVTPGGTVTEGMLEAPSRAEAVNRIQSAGHIPLRAVEENSAGDPGRGLSLSLLRRDRVTATDIVFFTRELATLLQAGLPLDHALRMLQGLSTRPAVRQLVQAVHVRIRAGEQLSRALEGHVNVFPRLYLNMVRAGETGGGLDTVLQRLADYLERSAELRAAVVSALIYPALLLVIAATSVFALLIFIVPQFEPLFADMDAALPLATRIVFGAAELVRGYGVLIVVLPALGNWAWRFWLREPANRLRRDAWLLQLPLQGSLITKLEVGRFSRTLATLLDNGVPLLVAVGLAREVLTNRALADDISVVASALEHGRGLARPLRDRSRFPALATQLIQVGEESGRLEAMLHSVADIYDRDCGIALKRMLAIVEPALILGLGAVIAFIILSILAAILGLNELVV